LATVDASVMAFRKLALSGRAGALYPNAIGDVPVRRVLLVNARTNALAAAPSSLTRAFQSHHAPSSASATAL
jgi:hypothetical protein